MNKQPGTTPADHIDTIGLDRRLEILAQAKIDLENCWTCGQQKRTHRVVAKVTRRGLGYFVMKSHHGGQCLPCASKAALAKNAARA